MSAHAARTVARNSAFNLVAQIAIKALSFLFTVYVVRDLGPEAYGTYAAIGAFGFLFIFIADLGLSPYGVREVARLRDLPDAPRKLADLHSDLLALRVLLSLLAGGLTGLILIQAFINLYAVMGMAPLTGVPLPLVSYGNNSLIVSMISIGLILNVARGGRAATVRKPVTGRGPGRNARLRLIDGEGHGRPERRTSGAQRRDSGRRYGGARGSGPRHSRRASR